MVNEGLEGVSEVYRTASACSVVLHPCASQPLVEDYRRTAKIALKVIPGPETLEWRMFWRETQQLSFALTHAVLPICHHSYDMLLTEDRIAQAMRDCDRSAEPALERLRTARAALTEAYVSPYRDLLQHLVTGPEFRSAIVVVEPRWIDDIHCHLRSAGNVRTLGIVSSKGPDLAGLGIYERLYVIGSLASHPESVITASRSADVQWLLYPWMKTCFTPRACLGSQRWWTFGAKASMPSLPSTGGAALVESPEEEDEEWTPPSRFWDAIANSIADQTHGYFELVEAKMLEVRGGDIVLVPTERNIDCIDPTTLVHAPELAIETKPGRSVQPGDYIIVYSRGSAEYVAAVADILLGPHADRCRSAQRRWKERLQQAVEDEGLDEVSQTLKVYGAVTAETYHLRYWISPYFIHPKDPRDFNAIMSAIGLGSDAAEYWDLMSEIMTNHQLAGKRIKAALREQLKTIDTHELVRSGRCDLGEGDDTGSLTVVCVEHVLADSRPVPEAHLLRFLE